MTNANNYGLTGLTSAGVEPMEPPSLVVIGREKAGKSGMTITLQDWPYPGGRPLVLAVDSTGIDSCASLGYAASCIKVKDAPGQTFFEKMTNVVSNIENAFKARAPNFPFTSLVVDCTSTLTDRLLREAKAKYADGRAAYGQVNDQTLYIMWKLKDIGVPVIWYAWLKEPFVSESGSGNQKRRKTTLGGPLIDGEQLRGKLAGNATQIMLLDKVNVGVGQAGADAQGYRRELRTRTFDNVECGGRYNQYLPDPCPPHLGLVLTQLMTRGQAFPQFVNPNFGFVVPTIPQGGIVGSQNGV